MAPKRQLYVTLGIAQDATESDISRAYRRLALQYHPDRNPEGEQKFKEIANAYSVLSDADKRRIYDATGVLPGNIEESEVTEAQRSAEMKERVQTFYSTYAGSKEEKEDLQKCYTKCKGNFRRMIREELLFDNGKEGEVARILALVKKLIELGKLQSTTAWEVTSSADAVRKIERAMTKERKEAADALKEMGFSHSDSKGNDMQSLQALIRRDQGAEWGNMMSNLEAKYLKPKGQDKAGQKKPAATHQKEPQKKKVRTQK